MAPLRPKVNPMTWMLKTVLLVLACWAVVLPAAWAVEVGEAVQDIALPGAAAAQKLSDFRGKVVYLDFWASWCGPCKQSFPWMNEMQRKYGDRGLQVVAVNLDAIRTEADAFLAAQPALFALAFDGHGVSARRIGIKGMPTSLLLGPDGRLLHLHQGFRPDDRAALEARMAAALAAHEGKAR